jgi:hypothetical protein
MRKLLGKVVVKVFVGLKMEKVRMKLMVGLEMGKVMLRVTLWARGG